MGTIPLRTLSIHVMPMKLPLQEGSMTYIIEFIILYQHVPAAGGVV